MFSSRPKHPTQVADEKDMDGANTLAYSWIGLRLKVQNRALGAEVGQVLAPWMTFVCILVSREPLQGVKRGYVRDKSSPSLAEEFIKRAVVPKMTHLARTSVFTTFSGCWGGPWRSLVGSRAPLKDPREANKPFVPACTDKGAIGIYGNGRDPEQMNANERKCSQT